MYALIKTADSEKDPPLRNKRKFKGIKRRNYIREKIEVPLLLKSIHFPKKQKILEIGCGQGSSLIPLYFSCQPKRLVGIDSDEKMRRRAQRRLRIREVPAEIYHEDVRNMPFRSESFDVIIDFGTCYDITWKNEAIKEIARVLAPGGIFIYETRFINLLAHPVRSFGKTIPWQVTPELKVHKAALLWSSRIKVNYSNGKLSMKNIKTGSKANEHERVNDILLGPLERPALKWLVEKMPKWVTPNLLTAVGLIAAVVIFLSYWLTNVSADFLWLASLGFVLNWFGDSLDGSLARHRKIERPKFGYFIDHTVDALTQLLVLLGIGLSPYVSMKFALFFLIGYFLLSIHTYITIYVKQVFKLSYGKFGPTEARVLAILANTVVYFFGIPSFSLPLLAITIYELAFFTVGTALILTFLISTIKQAVELSVVD